MVTRVRILISGVLFSFLAAGCAIFQPTGRPNDPLRALTYDIDAILSDSVFVPAYASLKIVSLDRGDVLYERDSKKLMRPASNMKLLTASAAISLLGKEHQFKTAISSTDTIRDGVLEGNLYFKGYGNPDLKTADLDTLVKQIKAAGISEIRGDVCADVSYFDDLYWGYGWNWDDEPYQYAAFLTPLTINDNCVRVLVGPGRAAGDSAFVSIEPATSYVSVVNTARTVADSVTRRLNVTRLFKERLNTIIVEGEVKTGSRLSETEISVWRPELYAAHLLKEALGRKGIRVSGSAVVRPSPTKVQEIALHQQRFDSMVVNLNKISDNLSAELTLKTLGAIRKGIPGSAQAGLYVVREFLSSLGIDTTKFLNADGSGLSYYNLITTEMLSQLLIGMARRPDVFPLFYESLPIAGVDGTLRNRMKGTFAEGNLRAKTGTISGVSSLSGYVKSRDGEMLVFSMTMQNFLQSSRFYRDAQDKIGALLAGFSRTSSSFATSR